MARKIAAAIMMCAVMVLVAAVPLVAGVDHTIIKGPQGPRASAMTWTYEPTEYGIWNAQLDNHGLRSLVIDVYDNTSGALELKLHQRIRFAAYDAYPSGIIYSESVPMAAGGTYEITATPNGPRQSYVVVSDQWTTAPPLVASFTKSVSGHTVNVDASASSGLISEYVWDWGDGSAMGSGVTASHTYLMPGTYTIVLTVLDTVGGSASASDTVTFPDLPPTAAFTVTVNGLDVTVDASGSTDDWGIQSYSWNWGDGTTGTGMIATHTYTPAKTTLSSYVVASNVGIEQAPIPPYYVAGYTYGPGGVKLPGCQLTIKNMRTGAVNTTASNATTAFYRFDLHTMTGDFMVNDLINITATKVTMIGWNESAIPATGSFMPMDITLSETAAQPFEVTITLTVTDTGGNTATAVQKVMIYP